MALLALALAPSALAATFTVTTNGTSGPGSLRQAILDSNLTGPGTVNTIQFALTFSNSVITLQTSLPPITGQVIVDGAAGGQQPRIDGSTVGGVGLQFAIPSAAQSQVRGLTITKFQTGLDLGTDSVIAAGNYIGTDSAGTPGLGNRIGVNVSGASLIGGNTAAERNVISDNGTGIAVTGGSGVVIEGNYIGPGPTGESPLAARAADRHHGQRRVGRNDRRNAPGSGNTISGLVQSAIILGNTTGDDVQGNIIGLTASQSRGSVLTSGSSSTAEPTTTRSAASVPART